MRIPARGLSRPRPWLLAALVAAVGSTHARQAAHEPAALEHASRAALRDAVGLEHTDGALRGVGPDYKLRFDLAGPLFTPALGQSVPQSQRLAYELESIRVGQRALLAAPLRSAAAHEGAWAHYERGAGVVERYELTRDGVEQSFLIEELPDRSGELVVRARLRTALPLPPSGDYPHGIELVLPEVGGVRIGAVTGIDASGLRAPGLLRVDGEHLEYVLPADFVAEAELPLLVDPLIGTKTLVAGLSNDLDPDVAFEPTTGTYLVAWERFFSAADFDIYGQRLTEDGSFLGFALVIEGANADVAFNPSVASVPTSSCFLVSWDQNAGLFTTNSVKARRVSASNGGLSSIVSVSASAASSFDNDVGGGLDSSRCLVAWTESGGGVRARVLEVQNIVDPTFISGVFNVTTDPDSDNVSISQSNGLGNRWLLAYESFYSSPAPGDHDITLQVVTSSGFLGASTAIGEVGPDEQDPAVDGDGEHFLVAYERELVPNSGDNDMYATALSVDSSIVELHQIVLDSGLADDEINPSVVWGPTSALVAWADEVGSSNSYDVWMRRVDPLAGTNIGGFVSVALGSEDEDFVALASNFHSGSSDSSQCLVVWESNDGSDGDIWAQRYEPESGQALDLGGGCSQGGRAYAMNASVGNAAFTHRLTKAGAFSAAFLVLSFDRIDVGCLSVCRIVPNPSSGFVFSGGTTDALGNAEVSMSIPSEATLAGLEFYEQWAVNDLLPDCNTLGVDLSNALQVEIE